MSYRIAIQGIIGLVISPTRDVTEPYPVSKMELFTKMVNGFKLSTIFAKCYVLNVCAH